MRARIRVTQPTGSPLLSDAETVALAAGTTELKAVELLRDLGGLRGLYHAGRGEIAKRIGPAAAARLLGSRDLCQRLEAAIIAERENMSDPRKVCQWAKQHLGKMDHEQLWVLCLDGRNSLITAKQVAEGGIHGIHVSVRDVLRAVIREAASGFVLVHVHPSGDPTPSEEDLEFTRKVISGAKEVGTPLVDHVVVARRDCASMHDRGTL